MHKIYFDNENRNENIQRVLDVFTYVYDSCVIWILAVFGWGFHPSLLVV